MTDTLWRMSRDEWRWAASRAALIVAATFVPYLVAWAMTPDGFVYTGFLYNPDEPNVHLSWMRQAWDGKFFFGDLFTTERAPDQFTNVFLWALGRSARGLHALWPGNPKDSASTLIAQYHLARFVCGALLLIGVYLFAAQMTDDARARRLTFYLAAVSSGLGWIDYVFGLPFEPADVNVNLVMPEAITFLSILLYPLFSFSMFLFVMTMTLAAANRERNDGRLHAALALCAATLANIHTYDMIPLWLTLGVWALTTRRPRFVVGLFLALLPSIAVVAWQFVVFSTNPVFREKALTPTPTPSPLNLAMTFGLIGLLAVIGAWQLIRYHDERAWLALVWAVIGLGVVYTPVSLVSFQRKMIEGLHLPLCVLAALALACAAQRQALLAPLLVTLTIPSSFAFLHLAFGYLADNNQSRAAVLMPPYYLHRDEVAALRWIERNMPDDAAVLCLPFVGSHLPGRTGKRVYVGHWAETLRFPEKLNTARRFCQGRLTESDLRALVGEGARYTLRGTYERAMFTPSTSTIEEQRFTKGEVTVGELP